MCKPNSTHQVIYNVEHKTHMYIVQSFAHTDSYKMKIILNHILSSNTKRLKLLVYLQQELHRTTLEGIKQLALIYTQGHSET